MKKSNYSVFAILVLFVTGCCDTSRLEITIIQDSKNNEVETSIVPTDTSSGSSSEPLGNQKISLSVYVSPSFAEQVTGVRVRAFTSRDPVVASTWMELSATTTEGLFVGIYDAAPNPTTKFGLHLQAFNGSELVGETAGPEAEYANNGDGSIIVGSVYLD